MRKERTRLSDEYVSLSLAKKLKAKGFNERCRFFYFKREKHYTPIFSKDFVAGEGAILIPTIYQVMRWLIKHPKNINIFVGFDIEMKYYYDLWILDDDNEMTPAGTGWGFKTYRNAIQHGILNALNYI